MRFVILRHEFPPDSHSAADPAALQPSPRSRVLHWDLMLERDGALQTWALEREPLSAEVIAAEQLTDHRLAYLDYEGPVSGNRGRVSRWDAGEYALEAATPERIVATLRGTRLRGRLTLAKSPTSHFWSVVFSLASSGG